MAKGSFNPTIRKPCDHGKLPREPFLISWRTGTLQFFLVFHSDCLRCTGPGHLSASSRSRCLSRQNTAATNLNANSISGTMWNFLAIPQQHKRLSKGADTSGMNLRGHRVTGTPKFSNVNCVLTEIRNKTHLLFSNCSPPSSPAYPTAPPFRQCTPFCLTSICLLPTCLAGKHRERLLVKVGQLYPG